MMDQQSAFRIEFDYFNPKPVVVEPSPAQVSSDGGLLAFRQLDEQLGRGTDNIQGIQLEGGTRQIVKKKWSDKLSLRQISQRNQKTFGCSPNELIPNLFLLFFCCSLLETTEKQWT